jgi:SecD/SecF fusion protein
MKRIENAYKNKNRILSLQLLLAAFVIVIVLIAFDSCKSGRTGNYTLTMLLKAEGKTTETGMNSTIELIKKRLTTYGVPEKNITISFVKDEISLKVEKADSTERLAVLASTTGNLEFWETYEYSDVYNFMEAANKKASLTLYGDVAKKKAYLDSLKNLKAKVKVENKKVEDTSSLVSKINNSDSQNGKKDDQSFAEFSIDNPLVAVLYPNFENKNGKFYIVKGPVVGCAKISDTARVNYILSLPEVRNCFPYDIKFVWAIKPVDDLKSFLQLLALKCTSRDGKAVIDGSVITKAKQDVDPSGNYIISMEMNNEGARIWKRFTAENIDKSIAIVLDNYVYSYPLVNAEIPNGHSQLSGKFSKAEAEDLATVLTLGKLPYTLKIIKSESTEIKK